LGEEGTVRRKTYQLLPISGKEESLEASSRARRDRGGLQPKVMARRCPGGEKKIAKTQKKGERRYDSRF